MRGTVRKVLSLFQHQQPGATVSGVQVGRPFLACFSVALQAVGQKWQAFPPLRLWILFGWLPLFSAPLSVAAAEKSLYDILGIDRGASEQEIKKAYKRSAVKSHPDKAPEGEREVYEERFKKISRAYEILSDPQKRHVYDQHGEAAFDGRDASGGGAPGGGMHGFPQGSDPFEMFRGMFGEGFGGFRGGGPRRTADVGYAMEVSLEEIYSGCKKDLRYEQDIVCTTCRGRGATKVETCRACGGQGVTLSRRQIAPGYETMVQSVCQTCGGQRVVVPPGCVCTKCRGAGITQKEVQLPVEVPSGCPDHARFQFRGKADESPDMETGDIIVEVWEKKHPVFKRIGDSDLLVDRRVSLLDALCGVRFSLKHLDGSDLTVDCPEGQIVRPGEVWAVKGRGMPRRNRQGHGDLLVRFEVDFPTELPGAQKASGVRDQLRPLIDPQAPASPRDAGSSGSKGWFGMGKDSSSSKATTASRASKSRGKEVEDQLAAQAAKERERQQEQQQRRGGGNAQCAQQ